MDTAGDDDLTPVSQTRQAFGLLTSSDDGNLEASLLSLGRRVREIAPDCVALSLSLWQRGLTFTLVADDRTSALMDAMQYLDGGPCVDAVTTTSPVRTELETAGIVDEERWRLFAQAGKQLGIATTLSLPVLEDDSVVAGVNLYGATAGAFDNAHEDLARVCGAWAEGAVTNADLDFDSRVRAAATPDRLLDQHEVDLAAGVVAGLLEVGPGEAVDRMRRAATRAGVSESEFARFVLDSQSSG